MRSTSQPEMAFNDEKVFPAEFDQDQQYIIANPSISPTFVGTIGGTQTVTAAVTIVQANLDYPRNVVGGISAASGSARGGNIVVNGFDQFGNVISETITISPANGGGTTNGTKVFAKVSSGTANFGTGDAGAGTATIGAAISGTPRFGLPARLGGTSDLKRATWLDADTSKMLNVNSVGTSATANVEDSSVLISVAGGPVAADSFVITYRSSFKNAEANQFIT